MIIAGYMYHRVQSKRQTSTHRGFLDEPVRVENHAVLLENEWFVKRDRNVLRLRVDNRPLQLGNHSCESFPETR
jgi:hypothetical protein